MKKVCILLLVSLVFACQSPANMEFKISHQQILKDVPSASGIVAHRDSYFVIGDDTPFLFKLNKEFDTIAHYPIHIASEDLKNRRIKKADKPDFEALEMISEDEIVGFGSGSKSPERDVFIRISMEDTLSVQQYSLTGFYDALKKMEVLNDSELNIEAAAYHADSLYLLNRRKNVIFRVNYRDFLDHVANEAAYPEITYSEYELPEMNGIEAGFSGADVSHDGKMVITASVEDTDNAYDDGEVLGSFIGVASLQTERIIEPIEWVEIENTTETLKVESVTIDAEISENEFDVILVTDSDGGESLILKGNLKW